MKTVIIGGVAAGTKTAAKLKREDPRGEIVIYSKSRDISYAGCGLPYHVGGVVESAEELVVNTPEKFTGLTGVPVHTNSEVTHVDPAAKTITVNGETVSYDRLVIAVGAKPLVPPVEGVHLPGVFTVRTPDDAAGIRSYAEGCKSAVVAGGGFIGLEMAENLMARGLSVTLIDMADQLMPSIFDADMADFVRRKLQEKGLRILLKTRLVSLSGDEKVTGVKTSSGDLSADLVILSLGIRPATGFLSDTGLEMEKGCILTDEYGKTSLADIYAVGDCALVRNRLTKERQWSAMGSTANIAGRALALTLGGEPTSYPGCLGTGVVKLSDDLNAARTGLTREQAVNAGYSVITALSVSDDKPHYYPGSGFFITKLIADRDTHRLLGAQILGRGAVDKMADVAVVGISAGLRAEDFITMDFSYAPPFSTAIHPFAAACQVLVNKLSGRLESMTPEEFTRGAARGYTLVDAQPSPSIPGAPWFDLNKAEEEANRYEKDAPLLLVCSRGKRAYLVQNRLKALGFTGTRVLEGGAFFNVVKPVLPKGGKLPPEEVKRLKGLGCLQDKRYSDVFNVRVITGNGKITSEEHRVIAEGAERFGSGEVAMTTRLTMEIQGVKYENIEPLREFLSEHGLETGGTGSLVRPVVSCKGTTCQYGLIDTYDLSRKIHRKFYQGYHKVTLPHKFKIAVGGCPNNCVKPELNDVGITGQLVPLFDFSKCRGCRKCQVETGCPVHAACVKEGTLQVENGACNGCGRCRGKCPFGVTEEYTNGYKITLGGRWGKKAAVGVPLSRLFLTEEEVMDTVERAILLFRDEGIPGERFADTVSRLGFSYVEEKLLHGEMKKEEILEKKVTGGATC